MKRSLRKEGRGKKDEVEKDKEDAGDGGGRG